MARRIPITAPPATPPRYSLLTAVGANGQTASAEQWENGVFWQPEACGGGNIMEASMTPQTAREAGDRPGVAIANPFWVWAEDNATATPSTQRDWQGRARRRLDATQSFQIAQELWTGAHTQDVVADPAERSPYLMDTLEVADVEAGGQEAIGIAEALAMRASEGRRVMVHVPIPVLEHAMADGSYVIRDVGGVLTTAMGNIVVADAGYPGTAPDAYEGDSDGMWIYTSPMVQVRLSAVETLPGSLADATGLAQALERTANNMTVWAQRLALYQLDPCARIAVSTDVPALPSLTTLS